MGEGNVLAYRVVLENGLLVNTLAKSATYTILVTDEMIITSGAITLTLPTAAAAKGKRIIIKTATGDNVLLQDSATGTDLIDGAANVAMDTQYDSLTIVSDGSTWHIISNDIA